MIPFLRGRQNQTQYWQQLLAGHDGAHGLGFEAVRFSGNTKDDHLFHTFYPTILNIMEGQSRNLMIDLAKRQIPSHPSLARVLARASDRRLVPLDPFGHC